MGTYVVRSGDTLHAIAQRHGLTLAMLLELNPGIDDPNLIHPGQAITIAETDTGEETPTTDTHELLPGFRGDLGWVHAREGHRGRPYWPGGVSGVTLDPGIDLGHCDLALAENLYGEILGPNQLEAVRKALGVRREEARALVERDAALRSIRITREQASALFPHAAAPYWRRLMARFPALTRRDTPASVHTVFLSLGFNRGTGNRHLEALTSHLERRDWEGLARRIGRMQQNHTLAGIRRRRRMEAALIRQGVGDARA